MRSCLVTACKPFRIVFVLALASLSSAWTCSAFINFNSCSGSVPVPQIVSLSPDTISVNTNSVVLNVNGSDLVHQSQILWNGNALLTTFADSTQLQTTITQQ